MDRIPLAGTGQGTGMTGDLEEEEDQGHVCLMVEHRLTLVSNGTYVAHLCLTEGGHELNIITGIKLISLNYCIKLISQIYIIM